jgi:succinoglycan biosynthesis protein ExoU
MSVAVIIAAMNAASTIGRAIRSALAQPEVVQVIVIDDGSSDATAASARDADDGSGRLLVDQLPINQGPSAARNRALDLATADYVAILDADDLLVPGRFARLLAVPQWDMIGDDILFVADDTDLDAVTVPNLALPSRRIDLADFIEGCIAQPSGMRSQLGFLKPVIRRALLDEHKLRYDERVRLGEDFLLYVELLRRDARFMLAGVVGYVAVERSDSLSARHTTEDLKALLGAEQAIVGTLPTGSREAHVMARRIAETDAKYGLRAFLQVKQQTGLRGALAWLGKRPGRWRRVTMGVLSDKLRAAQTKFRSRPVPSATPRRLLSCAGQTLD